MQSVDFQRRLLEIVDRILEVRVNGRDRMCMWSALYVKVRGSFPGPC